MTQQLEGIKLSKTAQTALISATVGITAWGIARAFWPKYQTPILIAGSAVGTIASEIYHSQKGMNGVGMGIPIGKALMMMNDVNSNNGAMSLAKRQALIFEHADPIAKAINDLTFSKLGSDYYHVLYKKWGMNYFHKPAQTIEAYYNYLAEIIQGLLQSGKKLRLTKNTAPFLEHLHKEGAITNDHIFEAGDLSARDWIGNLVVNHGGNFDFNSGGSNAQPNIVQSTLTNNKTASMGLMALAAAALIATSTKKTKK